jgi:hypothetical protein
MTKQEVKILAYKTMFEYLSAYYQRGKSDEIGGMLGSMSFLKDGGTADPAVWSDWEKAFELAQDKPKDDYNLNLKK